MFSRAADTPAKEKGISYSTLQQDVTVTTDSAMGGDLIIHGGGNGADTKGNQPLDNSDASYRVLPLIKESCPPKPLDQTAPLLKYEDFFKSEHTSLIEQTLLQRDFKDDSIFKKALRREEDDGAKSEESDCEEKGVSALRHHQRILPQSFLNPNLYYQDAFET
jgi:hypothetical protein